MPLINCQNRNLCSIFLSCHHHYTKTLIFVCVSSLAETGFLLHTTLMFFIMAVMSDNMDMVIVSATEVYKLFKNYSIS